MSIKNEYISFTKENRSLKIAKKIYLQRIKDSQLIFRKYEKKFSYRNCPYCGESKFNNFTKFNNQYHISKCNKCSSLYVNPVPNNEALEFYYNKCKCNKQLNDVFNKRAHKKNIIIDQKLHDLIDLIVIKLKTKKSIKILEIGCNSGVFLYKLKQQLLSLKIYKFVELSGIDIDKSAISSAKLKDVSLKCMTIEKIKNLGKKFDIIFHFELIEHLIDPHNFCKLIRKSLLKDGLMFFTTPNALGFDNKILSYNDFRPIAHAIFPPMHLNAFSNQNISNFLIRSKFSIVDINTPGNFDIDIVKKFSKKNILSKLNSKKYLAKIQKILQIVNGSSHLSVLAKK